MTRAQELRRALKSPRMALGASIVLLLLVSVTVGPFFTAHDPLVSDFTLSRDAYGAPPGPSFEHWLGTDALFRDVLARLLAGGRRSLAVALAATAMSSALGACVGLAAGLSAGGRFRFIDVALMRFVDVLLALPFLLFVTALGLAIGRADAMTVLLILGLTSWTGSARLVRSKTLELRERDFVAAAKTLGASPLRIVVRHLFPNLATPLLVLATSAVGHMILAEAVLSYLAMGSTPPEPTWGRMLHEAEPYLGVRLGLVAAPGFAILLSVIGFSRLGEGLGDALDPSTKDLVSRRGRVPFDLLLIGLAFVGVLLVRPPDLKGPIVSQAPSETATRGGTLHLATYVSLRMLDPAVAYDEAATAIEELVFARLLTWDEAGHMALDLASSYEESEDGLSVRFTLRRGVLFHDGATLTSADIKRSIERTLHPKTPSPAASLYASIVGFEDFHAGKSPTLAGIRTPAEDVVVFDLTAPDATFLPLLTMAFAAPVCPSLGSTYETSEHTLPCGAGPFRVTAWDPDHGVSLRRHEGYFEPGKPYLDGIEWLSGVRTTTQRYRFEDGSIDLWRDMSSADVAAYSSAPAWHGLGAWVTKKATNALFLNTELAPFDNVLVRRAVARAVDPRVLSLVRIEVEPFDRVIPTSIPGPPREGTLRHHDLDAALALMAEAGFPFDPQTGKGGYPEPIDYYAVGDSFDQQVGEVLQQQLARIGIRLTLRMVTYPTFLAEVGRRKRVPMGATGWNADFPDPSNFFEPTLASSAIQEEGSSNVAFYSSPAFDALLRRAHVEREPQARMRLYAEAERMIAEDAPWIPLYGTRTHEVWQPYVRGYRPHPYVAARYADVWLDKRDDARLSALGSPKGPLAFVPFALGARR